MLSTNIASFREDIFSYTEQAIKFNQMVNINTNAGSAVMMSLSDYNSLMETIYLFSHLATATDIKEGIRTAWEDCVPESEVKLAWSMKLTPQISEYSVLIK